MSSKQVGEYSDVMGNVSDERINVCLERKLDYENYQPKNFK